MIMLAIICSAFSFIHLENQLGVLIFFFRLFLCILRYLHIVLFSRCYTDCTDICRTPASVEYQLESFDSNVSLELSYFLSNGLIMEKCI